jgi:hypothetical protein
MNLEKIENELVKRIEGLKADIDAIQQPRSNFALEHFVVAQHVTPERQYMQTVLELQIKMFNIQRAQLEERKLHLEKEEQEEIRDRWTTSRRGKARAQIEIERIQTDLAELNLARIGATREAECLLAILDKLPNFTYEELQRAEPLYWVARMSDQALRDMKTMGAIGQGNLEAIGQMFRSPGDRVAGLSVDELISLAEIGMKVLPAGKK